MVDLLRSISLMQLNTVTMDVGLEEPTTLNDWLCFSCWRYFGDNMIDAASGLCLRCVHVSPNDEGEEDENELPMD
jgi:hypothetical protein